MKRASGRHLRIKSAKRQCSGVFSRKNRTGPSGSGFARDPMEEVGEVGVELIRVEVSPQANLCAAGFPRIASAAPPNALKKCVSGAGRYRRMGAKHGLEPSRPYSAAPRRRRRYRHVESEGSTAAVESATGVTTEEQGGRMVYLHFPTRTPACGRRKKQNNLSYMFCNKEN